MYTFIVNPIAGRGKPIKCMDKIVEYLNHLQIPFEVLYTKAPGHAADIAFKLTKQNDIKAIVAVGGDGTVAEVASGIVNTDCMMGIIPAGTGNDYRRSLDIPYETLSAMDIILKNNIRKVDIVKINDKPFLNNITEGLDVE